MSTTAPQQMKKKFTGFTPFFKNQVQPKRNTKQKQPFTGFSEFYKKLKEREMLDEYEGSECDSIILQMRRKIKEEKPPEPLDKHFKPLGYYTWCKEKIHFALDRCAEEHGDVPVQNGDNEGEKAESIKTNPLFVEIKNSSRRKYESRRKVYDQSEHDNLSQISGINPWFHNILNKWRNEPYEKTRNEDFEDTFQVNEGLQNIYRNLNAKQVPQLDDKIPRNVNTYPSELQFNFLNKRMKKFLEKTKHHKNEENNSQSGSTKTMGNPQNQDFNVMLTAEKKELVEYFDKIVKPIRPINFKQEDFKTWYIKMSSNYDCKYKDTPKTDILPEIEDFNSWFSRNTEIMNKKYNNEFYKAMYSEKLKYTGKFEKTDTMDEIMALSDVDLNKSVSNLSSCRSRWLK